MENQTIIATALALLIAALFAGVSYYARKELNLKQWQTAIDYAELVVNSIDKLYEDGQLVKSQRLQAAMDALTTRCPWLKSEEAHTLIHGWLNIIRQEQTTIATSTTDMKIEPSLPLPPGLPAPEPYQRKKTL